MTDNDDDDVVSRGDFRRLEDKIAKLSEEVAKLMPRAEIESALSNRVSLDAFAAVIDRVARLENGPQRQLGWISLFVSGGVGCIATFVAIITIAVTIALHFWK